MTDLERLQKEAEDALSQGRAVEAREKWRELVQLAPHHVAGQRTVGRLAFKSCDWPEALEALSRAAGLQPSNPQVWTDLALVHEQLGDEIAAEQAVTAALEADPSDLLALLMQGRRHERHGRSLLAARAYGAAAAVVPPAADLPPELHGAVAHASRFAELHQQQLAAYLDSSLSGAFAATRGENLQRFRLALEILQGRKKRHDSQPMRFFFPGLAPVEFFDRTAFPWLEPLEAGTSAVQEELRAVLRDDAAGLGPYIAYKAGEPVAQWAELNHSPRWSAYHLEKDGAPLAQHVARCPRTMALIGQAPRPDQPGRTPVSMFSLLKPRTRIPPHVGASNTRLLCHLPLVIPPHCGFRVGNTVREWKVGQAWIFDDTIEHEAWNDSDQLRVILIFDTWHPALTAAERHMITAMNLALNGFTGSDSTYGA